jgi:DNA helicase-2/ATP-dependent DNA helicase PcrA
MESSSNSISLNEKQKKAIQIINKPLVIIAGPGTGKTTLITKKISHLINNNKINEENILGITFTNKSASQISQRVEIETSKPFFAKTFHQFCLEIIEDYQNHIPHIDKNYTLIDETNQLLFFLENLEEFNLSSIQIKNNISQIANELQSTISKLKDFSISLSDFENLIKNPQSKKDFPYLNKSQSNISSMMDMFIAYSKYEIYKNKNNFIDFGDIHLYVKELLLNNPKIKEELSDKYKYILIDEFQDTNQIQLEIIKQISNNNITIVGDQKQSIYEFRGANFENLSLFKKQFPTHQIIYLDENYRSSKEVLENINKLTQNFASKEELLKPNSKEKGQTQLIEAQNENSQNTSATENINKIIKKDPNATIGILFRRKSELKIFSSYLKDLGIEHKADEAISFFELGIIKSIINQCHIINNPHESDSLVFKLLLDYGVRPQTMQALLRLSSFKKKSLYDILAKNDIKNYEDEKDLIKQIIDKIKCLINQKNSKISLYDLIIQIIYEFNNYKNAIENNNKENINAINKFVEFVSKYIETYKKHNLSRFLQICEHTKSLNISYEIENESQKIELLTIHASKGKEFDHVIIPYLNERRFPSNFKRTKFEIFNEDKEKFLNEEKRLFFVAISRAKSTIQLLYVKKYDDNKLDSNPSVFLDILKLKKQPFSKETPRLNLNKEDEIKLEIINKIKNFIFENQYDLAQAEINLLKDLFSKKDLNYYMKKSSHPQYDYYSKLTNDSKKEDIKFDPKQKIYSVSQLQTYASCPKKYLYQYVYKIPTTSKHYFDFGTTMHNVLEDMITQIPKFSKEALYSKAISLLSQQWISKGYLNAKQEKEYFQLGIESIKKFIDKETELQKSGIKTISTEEKFILDFENKKIMGFIDRIDKDDKGYCIIDYKTSNSTQTQASLKDNLQLYVYSLAIEKKYGKIPSSVGLWYLIHDQIISIDPSKINSEELKKTIRETIKEIENLNFSAIPSHFSCKFCDYNQICDDSK